MSLTFEQEKIIDIFGASPDIVSSKATKILLEMLLRFSEQNDTVIFSFSGSRQMNELGREISESVQNINKTKGKQNITNQMKSAAINLHIADCPLSYIPGCQNQAGQAIIISRKPRKFIASNAWPKDTKLVRITNQIVNKMLKEKHAALSGLVKPSDYRSQLYVIKPRRAHKSTREGNRRRNDFRTLPLITLRDTGNLKRTPQTPGRLNPPVSPTE